MLPLAAPIVESTTRSAIVIGITLCPTTSITWFLFKKMHFRVALLLKYRGAYLSSTEMKRNLVAHSLATASELMTSMGARMVR